MVSLCNLECMRSSSCEGAMRGFVVAGLAGALLSLPFSAEALTLTFSVPGEVTASSFDDLAVGTTFNLTGTADLTQTPDGVPITSIPPSGVFAFTIFENYTFDIPETGLP